MMKKFMNPLVDAGFKRIFGRKKYMREFLNDLLRREHPIKHIWFMDKEMVPDSDRDHGVVYDLYCIYLLNFHLESDEPDMRQRKVMLTDVLTNKVFYDRMTMYFLELPTYRKCTEKECESDIDKWLFVLTNMNRFKTFPFKKDKPIFMQMEELASLATFSKEEMRMYEDSLDRYRISRLTMKTCHDEGVEQGIKQGIKQGVEQVAKKMKDVQTPIEVIMEMTGLTQDQIEKL
ncbi:MAG: Rpn family recombination-promoting nuclease/putative transposase [Paludibacteraceae bacterium]|nr:Rpn family recombination-promoting nuclease/putative transposase [Paludibacteraceae bacterium]